MPLPGQRAASVGSDSTAGNRALGNIERAISGGFDDLEANPDSGGEVRLADADEVEERRQDPPEPDDADDVDDDADADADGEEDEASPAPASDPAAKPEGDKGASPATAAPEGSSTVPQPEVVDVPALLKEYSPEELNAIRKFLPRNTIEGVTKEAFREARAKVGQDFWRLQNENAALAKGKPEAGKEASPAASEAKATEPAAELRPLIEREEKINAAGRKAEAQVQAWDETIADIGAKIQAAEAERAEGVQNADELSQLYRKQAEARRSQSQWRSQISQLLEQRSDVQQRRSEVQLALDTRDRLARQEKEIEQTKQNESLAKFDSTWTSSILELAKEKGIPQFAADGKTETKRFAALRDFAVGKTQAELRKEGFYFKPEDIRPFLAGVVTAYAEAHEETVQEARKGYAEQKAADAPKVPVQARRAKPKAKARTAASVTSSLRELEGKINKDPAWDNL
jgi:hypothetical protein